MSPICEKPDATARSTTLSSYFGGSSASRYRQAKMGFGKRYDFTMANVQDKGEAKYEFENFGSIRKNLEHRRKFGTKAPHTF